MERTPHNSFTNMCLEISRAFFDMLHERPRTVLVAWFFLFVVLFGISWSLGIVPKLEDDDAIAAEVTVATSTSETSEEIYIDGTPARIIIDAIDVDATIITPPSTELSDLDEALLQGVVHYPGSGSLNDVRNVFLFGHSTGFRVVQNQAFKVFNNLKELTKNDLIRVQSMTHEYVYRVMSVELANAEEVNVDFRSNVRMLTLSTCNAFGAKEERYIVLAEFVGEFPL